MKIIAPKPSTESVAERLLYTSNTQRTSRFLLLILVGAGILFVTPGYAEPPSPRKVVRHVHQRISGLFYKAARILEGDTSERDYNNPREKEREQEYRSHSAKPRNVEDRRSANPNRSETVVVVPPLTQQQPGVVLKTRRSTNESRANPSIQPIDSEELRGYNSTTEERTRHTEETRNHLGDRTTSSRSGLQSVSTQSSDSDDNAKTNTQANIYATPVPGKPGFVYPPGADKSNANMLDVRGLTSGQKARDPRTGAVFLVP